MYNPQHLALDQVTHYAQCISTSKKTLQNFEKTGKIRLAFMEISAAKNPEFKLLESISQFI